MRGGVNIWMRIVGTYQNPPTPHTHPGVTQLYLREFKSRQLIHSFTMLNICLHVEKAGEGQVLVPVKL